MLVVIKKNLKIQLDGCITTKSHQKVYIGDRMGTEGDKGITEGQI